MKKGRKINISLSVDDAVRRDLVLFNNPVLIQGLALTPVVAAANSLRNAAILAIAAFVIIIPTRVIGDMLMRFCASKLRMMIYALMAALFYIPAVLLTQLVFQSAAFSTGIYLPLLVVDGIVLSRAEIPVREGWYVALWNGFRTAVGFAVALFAVGSVRELLGDGRLFGFQLLEKGPLPIAGTVAGGFISVALFAALVQWGAGAYKRANFGGVSADD